MQLRDRLSHKTRLRRDNLRLTVVGALSLLFVVYSVAVYALNREAGAVSSGAAYHDGAMMWRKHNCASCHQIYGLGGYMGPDLTNVASRRDAAAIRSVVTYGTRRMPPHRLTDGEMDALLGFLRHLDGTGSPYVPSSAVRWTGSYHIGGR